MNILIPLTITDAMVGAGTTIAEPAPGEVAWTDAATYAVGTRRIVAALHRVYECVVAIATATGKSPELDAVHWLEAGPTQRWAPFDNYVNTAANDVTSITYVLSPGYFNAVSLYGLIGSGIVISVKDSPGGAVIYRYPETGVAALIDAPTGWYNYLFSKRRSINQLLKSGIPIRPAAELTVTVSAAVGQPVGIGMINVGDLRPLIGNAAWGGTVAGATAEPITYSYIKTNDDGTTQIVRRHRATNLRCTVVMPVKSGDAALQSVQEVLDVPCSWIATDVPGFDGLNVFGIGSGSLSYTSTVAEFSITVKGLI